IAWAQMLLCQFGAMLDAVDQGLVHAQRTANARWEGELPGWKSTALFHGPTPVDEVLRWHEEQQSQHPLALWGRAVLEAMRGSFEDARTLLAAGNTRAEELGQTLILVAGGGMAGWDLEMLAEEPASAEAVARRCCELLEQLGDSGMRSLASGQL